MRSVNRHAAPTRGAMLLRSGFTSADEFAAATGEQDAQPGRIEVRRQAVGFGERRLILVSRAVHQRQPIRHPPRILRVHVTLPASRLGFA